jgi:hypothetical protein
VICKSWYVRVYPEVKIWYPLYMRCGWGSADPNGGVLQRGMEMSRFYVFVREGIVIFEVVVTALLGRGSCLPGDWGIRFGKKGVVRFWEVMERVISTCRYMKDGEFTLEE